MVVAGPEYSYVFAVWYIAFTIYGVVYTRCLSVRALCESAKNDCDMSYW